MKQNSILSKFITNYKVTDEELSTIFAITLLAKFLSHSIEHFDAKEFMVVLQKIITSGKLSKTFEEGSTAYRTYSFWWEKVFNSKTLNKIGKDNLNKIIGSCILFVNEDEELKPIFNSWATNAKAGVVDISQKGTTLDVHISLIGRPPFLKKYIINNKNHTNHISTIGQKDIKNDYGIAKQVNFIKNFIGFDVSDKKVLDNYKEIANNGNLPSSDSIFNASKMLYQYLQVEVNKIINYDNTMGMDIANSVKRGLYGDEYENTLILKFDNEFKLYKLDFDKLVFLLKHQNVRLVQSNTKAPILNIVNTKDNKRNNLVRIRMKKEKYKNNITEHRYKIYVELSDTLLTRMIT